MSKEEIKKEIEKKQSKSKVDELTEDLKRLQAEFENYRKRTEKECQQFKEFANEQLLEKFLPVLDNFDLAIKNKEKKEEFIKAIELIYAQFLDTLKKEGLEKLETKKLFDPYMHEALVAEESDKPENTILEIFQEGYKLKNKIIRPAKVKVAKHDNQENSKEENT